MKKTTVKLAILFACLILTKLVMGQACLTNLTNPTSCDLELCLDWGLDCNNDGMPDQVSRECFNLPAGSTTPICLPAFPSPGCNVVVASASFQVVNSNYPNSPITQMPASFISFLTSSGAGMFNQMPVNGNDNGCLNNLTFVKDEAGNITLNNECPKYCFQNNTDCYLEITISTRNGDKECTPDFDFENVTITKILRSGESFCIQNFGTEECPICAYDVVMNICGENGIPCGSFDPSKGGTVIINCGGQLINIGVVLINGVYQINRL